jgi:ABC-type antimicrobial peptide transport system permease subunit
VQRSLPDPFPFPQAHVATRSRRPATDMPPSFAATTAIPFGNIVVLVIVAAMAGVVSALLPARRAGKLNVLDAIAS